MPTVLLLYGNYVKVRILQDLRTARTGDTVQEDAVGRRFRSQRAQKQPQNNNTPKTTTKTTHDGPFREEVQGIHAALPSELLNRVGAGELHSIIEGTDATEKLPRQTTVDMARTWVGPRGSGPRSSPSSRPRTVDPLRGDGTVERSTPTNRSHAEVAATEDAVTNDNDAKVADLIEEPPAGRLNKKRKKYHPPGYAADFVDVPYFDGSPSYQPSQVVQGIIDVVGVIPQRERSTIFPFDVAHVGSDEMRGRLLNMYLARFFMDVFSVYSGMYMTHKYDQQRSLRYTCTTESCSFTVLFLLHKRTRDACKMKVGELRQVVLRHSSHCPHSHPPSEGCRIDL